MVEERVWVRGDLLTVALAVALLWPAGIAQAAAPYSKGDHVLFSGQVQSTEGEAVGNVTVLLELSRTSFSLRRFKQVKKNTLQIPVVATVGGQYLHDWRWDGYYNTFELAVGLPRKQGGRDDFEILYRTEITDSVQKGGPVVTPLVIGEDATLDWLRRLLDGTAGDEERRVFQEMGRPQRYDRVDDGSSAWWYFEAGKVYRFRDGVLEQVEHFEPIKSE